MMKNIVLFLFCLLMTGATQVNAQKTSVFLFPDFTQGTILMKNGAKTIAQLNYDAANRRMMFKQGNDLMILTNAESVDTIYLDNRKFFPVKGYLFLECVPCVNGTIYVNWSLRNKFQGQKGAYGQVSHAANIETINTDYWTNNGYDKESLDVYKIDNDNEYWLNLDGKFVHCRNKKTLLKLFPEHKQKKIEEYIKERDIDISKAEQMIELLNYCIGLE